MKKRNENDKNTNFMMKNNKRANPKVPDMTPEGFDQVYLPNSNRFMDDILIHNSPLGGSIENEKLWFQILVMNL